MGFHVAVAINVVMFGRVSCCLLLPVSSLCRRWSLLYLFPSRFRFRSWSSSSLPKATDLLLPPSSRLSTPQLKRRPNTSSPRQDDPSTSPRAIARGPGKFSVARGGRDERKEEPSDCHPSSSLPLRVGTRRHLTPSLPEGTCSALGARRINKPLFLRGEPRFFIHPNFFHTSSFGKNFLFLFRVVLHPGLRSWEEVDKKQAWLCCG